MSFRNTLILISLSFFFAESAPPPYQRSKMLRLRDTGMCAITPPGPEQQLS